jgi:hypothetical protein
MESCQPIKRLRDKKKKVNLLSIVKSGNVDITHVATLQKVVLLEK